MNIIPDKDLPEPEFYYIYFYNYDGSLGHKYKVIPDHLDEVFTTAVLQAKHDKVKVILTDEWDNTCFHMENGEVLFPKPHHMPNADLDSLLN